MSNDQVHHPRHYTAHKSGVECIEISEHLSFCLGNALKYLWRSGLKDGQPSSVDLQKAAWYLRREATWVGAGGCDGMSLTSQAMKAAARVLAHEPEGTHLAVMLAVVAEGWSVPSDLRALADRLDPEGAKP